jgi:hypothetical protein
MCVLGNAIMIPDASYSSWKSVEGASFIFIVVAYSCCWPRKYILMVWKTAVGRDGENDDSPSSCDGERIIIVIIMPLLLSCCCRTKTYAIWIADDDLDTDKVFLLLTKAE